MSIRRALLALSILVVWSASHAARNGVPNSLAWKQCSLLLMNHSSLRCISTRHVESLISDAVVVGLQWSSYAGHRREASLTASISLQP